MIIFGTRPEVIKLAPIILEARKRADQLSLIICSTGQHSEMLTQTLAVFGITPDESLDVMRPGQTLIELSSRLMAGIGEVLDKYAPDLVVVQGDTTSALIGALAAYYQKIPVAHIEAGLRTGDIYSPFPEEGNRLLISKIARLNFAPTVAARNALLSEGVSESSINVVGNTVVDAVELIKNKWINEPYTGSMNEIFPDKDLVLITTHRRENFGSGLKNICNAIKRICEKYPNYGFVYPVHMNPNVREIVDIKLSDIKNLKLLSPVSFEELLYLQSRSILILTDSGGIQEEAPSFGVKCIVMREHTERHEGIDAGYAYLAGTSPEKITLLAYYCIDNQNSWEGGSENPYGDGESAKRIIHAVINYFAN